MSVPSARCLGLGLLLVACTGHAGADEREAPIEKVQVPTKPQPAVDKKAEPRNEALEAAARRSDISLDEQVQLFPTFIAADENGRVRGRLEGWIYEEEEEDDLREVFVSGLRRGLGVGDYELDAGLAMQRIRPFIYDDERGERVEVLVGDRVLTGSRSGKGGRFHIPVDFEHAPYARLDKAMPLPVRAIGKPGDQRVFETPVFVLPAQGLLIVSDVDDTIKVTKVGDRSEMLRRTFLEPFEAVPGMAAAYHSWLNHHGGGKHVHFLSSSPWQLLDPLEEMIVAEKFPHHSYRLRDFRVDVMDAAKLLTAPDHHKARALESIFEQLPDWQVVLVGDSGERDPEIYAEAARKHPDQVVAVFIRNVTEEGPAAPRYEELMKDIGRIRWQVFDSADELPSKL